MFLLRGLDYQNRAGGVTNDGFGSGTEKNAAEAGPAVRGDHDQVDFAFLSYAHNLRRRLAVHHQFLDVESRTLVTFSQFRQFALG